MRDVWERFDSKVKAVARRAGVREVPPGTAVVFAILAVCAIVWAMWHWWPSGDGVSVSAASDPGPVGMAPSATPSSSVEATGSAEVFVHVAGAVRRPGVYRLDAADRVIDAVEAAGGLLGSAESSAVNLARMVADGEQIVVPAKGETPPPPAAVGGVAAGGASSAGSAPGSPVNINTADATALDALPGVGPSTAQKIVADREANGPFAAVEDLGRVAGIGPKKLEQLSGLISVR